MTLRAEAEQPASKEESINLEDDEQIMELKNDIEKQSKLDEDIIIGSTLVYLDGKEDQIRSRESKLGSLITDSMLAAVKADLALINSRTINSSIKEGLISLRDIKEVLPAQDELVLKKIKGSALIKTLAHAVSEYPETAGFFPQLSGCRLIFAEKKNSENEILKVFIDSKPLKAEKYYLLATNDSLASGGDGFEEIKKAEKIKNFGRLDQILINYLQQKEIIESVELGRIITVEQKGENYLYEVQKGEYLYLIAAKFSVSVAEIIRANEIENRSMIYQGQQLIIPGLR
jgi:2',3'-cyclic-nucleotide 2'-phosphodiesterase (5'-nucleotidase family)